MQRVTWLIRLQDPLLTFLSFFSGLFFNLNLSFAGKVYEMHIFDLVTSFFNFVNFSVFSIPFDQ